MPLKHYDPFASSIDRLNPHINPYMARMRDAAADGSLPIAFGDGLRELPGRWREVISTFYQRTSPLRRLVVEIGCHKGHTLLAMARNHPDTAFVGVDITYKRVVTTAHRAISAGLSNVYCVLANAVSVDRIFAASEADGAVIFFPDPWVKKKSQAKNRLVDAAFCGRLRMALSPSGFCWFKTDQKLYFDLASQAFMAAGFQPLGDTNAMVHSELATDYTSVFEQRFHEQNLPTYSAKWARIPDATL